jgi:hypothetical protein
MEEGESSKEEGEDGKYGKNGKEVRSGMATSEAGQARNCSRPFCPKLEIQHDRRRRGVATLTIRREEKMVL